MHSNLGKESGFEGDFEKAASASEGTKAGGKLRGVDQK